MLSASHGPILEMRPYCRCVFRFSLQWSISISLLVVHKVGHSYNLMVWWALNYKQVTFREARLGLIFVFFHFILGKYPESWDLMRVLDLRLSDMHYPMRDLADIIARRHGLRIVGDLYDFLCEKGLPFFADIL